jgi:hypothetical protein
LLTVGPAADRGSWPSAICFLRMLNRPSIARGVRFNFAAIEIEDLPAALISSSWRSSPSVHSYFLFKTIVAAAANGLSAASTEVLTASKLIDLPETSAPSSAVS